MAAAAPAPPPPPPVPQRAPFDWESLIGVRLFSWMAGIMLAIAAILFLRYSIQHGLLSAPVRLAIGVLTGAGLIVACELKAARRYPVTANALDAAGVAILFATFFAAHALWGLLGAGTSFLLMALVAAVAVALAIRRDSPFIAVLGLLGGFATPALLSTGQDRPIALFGYLLLLDAGLAWVALQRRWPLLSALALAFTTFYEWTWVVRFLGPDRLPLAIGIFLVFPVLYVAASALARRTEDRTFAKVTVWSLGLPLLLGLYLAAAPGFGEHWRLLFGYLLLLDLGIAVFAAARRAPRLHEAAAGASLLALVAWLLASYDHEAWPAVLGFVVAWMLLYLAAPWVSRRLGRPLETSALAGTAFLAAAPILIVLEPATAAPGLLFGVLFLMLAAAGGFALFYEDGRIHYVAALFAVGAEALWSARHLNERTLVPALVLYASFGLLLLGIPLLARRFGRRLRPEEAGSFLLLASLLLLFFLAAGPVAAGAVWGLALLLVILNAGLAVEARSGSRPLWAWIGLALSWIVLAVWWATAPVETMLVPALLLVALLTGVALAGSWRPGAAVSGAGTGGQGIWLALVGHAFLLFVASQARLAIPPWPLLGALLLLDLAIGVAVLWLGLGALQVGAVGMSGLILLLWTYVVVGPGDIAPWPSVAVGAAFALAAFALGWIALARRREGRLAADAGELVRRCSDAAVIALLAGELVLIRVGAVADPPPLGLALPVHVLFLVAVLALAERTGRAWLASAWVPFVFVAAAGWGARAEPWPRLLFGAVLLAVYLIHPFALGERARRSYHPWLAAVLASVAYFLIARIGLIDLQLERYLGALPVLLAAALAVLLRRLLRFVPPGERKDGRLALVAGAVLAFVTVAIPLQLEKQWVTIGWALLAAALAWLYGRVPHRGLLLWTAGLIAAVFVRLALNPAVLSYHPRAETPIWNWYLYAYLVAAAALLVAAAWLRRTDDRLAPRVPRLSALASAAAGVLLFLLLNLEIADWFSTRTALTFGALAGRATLAEGLTYTLAWAIFALVLLLVGIVARSRPARIAAIALLLATVLKGFLLDLGRLGGLYRIGSFLGLAICLAAVALLIQRFVLEKRVEGA